MILATVIDVAICTGILIGIVTLCVLGHWAMAGRDVQR